MPANKDWSEDWHHLRKSALQAYSAGDCGGCRVFPPPFFRRPVAPVTCTLGAPEELQSEIGSDLLRWLVLADTPYWGPLHISEAAIIAAWRAKKRLVRRLTDHPLLHHPPVPADKLPFPHLAIAKVRSKKYPPCRDWLPLLDRLLPDTMADLRGRSQAPHPLPPGMVN